MISYQVCVAASGCPFGKKTDHRMSVLLRLDVPDMSKKRRNL